MYFSPLPTPPIHQVQPKHYLLSGDFLGTSGFIDCMPTVGGTTPASEILSSPRVAFYSTCAVLRNPCVSFLLYPLRF